ncbi:uncharacterized protein LOC121805075 isoform X1 [Salvia splendens]|uniref:uncharacterized protein LOC121805075 isoform X1 n=1 Tax=Salvia splendens TaxID=180675 RepID=UPI001C25D32B|nr:uncharacterized protein LOC121805075 isoform X1 [Salvia splendens]XP_042060763.1 uncharacterized protein LOC121805075 isoform X1 [Salvia splendens]XP_042060764.1 uncharacterized protein LOC121805075 isoform X1 [Salvia splendens]
MDHMDIDEILEVPDTPDRLAKNGANGKNGAKTENQRSSMPRRELMFPEEGSRDQPMIIDSGSRGLSLRPPKRPSIPKNSQFPNTSVSISLESSPSSRNSNLYRKGVAEKKPGYPTHDSMHKRMESVRPSHPSKSSSSFHDDDILELSEWSLHRPARKNASPSAIPGNNRTDFQKRSDLPNGTSSNDLSNLTNICCNGSEEKKKPSRGGLGINLGERVGSVGINKKKTENGGISSDPIALPRVSKQKRLVRNGCISPNNIAKAKQLVGNGVNSSVVVGHNTGPVAIDHNIGSRSSNPVPVSIDIRDLVAEDDYSNSRKGKRVISHPCSSRRLDLETKDLLGRNSVNPSEKAVESVDYNCDAGKSIEESAGWRSTRNRPRGMNDISSNDKEKNLNKEWVTPRLSFQQHETRSDRRGRGINLANCDNDSSFISSEHFHAQSVKESVSHPRARMGRLNEPHSAAGMLIKRQKQGSGFSSSGECSTSVSDNLDFVSLSSPAEAANLRSSSNANMPPVIEVDESSPQPPHDTGDDNARARQLEADELMARQLQEQLYNEMPAFGFQETDEHVALALQRQEGPSHGHSRGRAPVFDVRSMSNLFRQSASRSSSNAPRRGYVARSPPSGRMTRQRGRFPGQPRTLSSSRQGNSMFPPDMDIDMRMEILGALEEFSDMGMNASILHSNRDFNENDYEMLLALDDNNSQGGASGHQINGLPQSTVQTDHEEACAVCLETPTTGEKIRHLPCLHKFHKDCIDPWLRRRSSCPVCKSSIT